MNTAILKSHARQKGEQGGGQNPEHHPEKKEPLGRTYLSKQLIFLILSQRQGSTQSLPGKGDSRDSHDTLHKDRGGGHG